MRRGLSLSNQVLVALPAGVVFGYAFPRAGAFVKPLGELFISLINMILVPVVLTAVVSAVAQLKEVRRVGRVGSIALLFTVAVNLVAAVFGLAAGILAHPAAGVALPLQQPAGSVVRVSVVSIIMSIVPSNIFAALSQGEILPILFFSVLLGLAIISLGERGSALANFFAVARDAVFVVVGWIMRTAPLGVFALMAATVASQGSQVLLALLRFLLVIWSACILWLVLFQSALVKFVLRINVTGFYKAMSEVALIGFTTCSSAATVPINMKHTHERLGVSRPVAEFIIGLGATTTGRAGSCIYSAIAVAFAAGLYGVKFGFVQFLSTSLLIVLIWLGGTGIPGGATILMTAVLKGVGLPLAPVALMMSVDRLRDMIITMTNVLLQSSTAAVCAVLAGEKLTLVTASEKPAATVRAGA